MVLMDECAVIVDFPGAFRMVLELVDPLPLWLHSRFTITLALDIALPQHTRALSPTCRQSCEPFATCGV